MFDATHRWREDASFPCGRVHRIPKKCERGARLTSASYSCWYGRRPAGHASTFTITVTKSDPDKGRRVRRESLAVTPLAFPSR